MGKLFYEGALIGAIDLYGYIVGVAGLWGNSGGTTDL